MPSQITHALAAERLASLLPDSEANSDLYWLYLGAQGPDIFFYSLRRKPRGIYYGTILHRKGNADLVCSIAEQVAQTTGFLGNHFYHYLLGWISHVFLDRNMHPYINYRAGWHGVPDTNPLRRYMHAFLERIIDTQLLYLLRGIEPSDFRLHDTLQVHLTIPEELHTTLTVSLKGVSRAAEIDEELDIRISNAYLDMMGYYAFVDNPPDRYYFEARRREMEGELSERWLSIVHPRREWISFDSLNLDHIWWHHPCIIGWSSNYSVPDLFEESIRDSLGAARLLHALRNDVEPRYRREFLGDLRSSLGTTNLNDGLTGDTGCRREIAAPLPLISLYERIKRRLSDPG